jgi:phosphoenolpyruvate carboxylase
MVPRPRALTPSEIESIMARMPKQRDRLLVALMGYGRIATLRSDRAGMGQASATIS